MLNFYDDTRDGIEASKHTLNIGEFLFVQYTCVTADSFSFWTHADYLVTIVSGKKTWSTADGVWVGNPGETLFFKKGAAMVEGHIEPNFCLLIFFIPDGFARATVRELAGSLGPAPKETPPLKTAIRVETDTALTAFFQSMQTYLFSEERPSEPLLQLKLKELMLSILVSDKNRELAAYFRQLGESDTPSLSEIMEANYRYNLSLEEYARLCHRSLSSFKRDFREAFQETPGRWLLQKRLAYSAALLRSSKMNVTEIAFESGFEDVSHFSRTFKDRFGTSPLVYRQTDLVVD